MRVDTYATSADMAPAIRPGERVQEQAQRRPPQRPRLGQSVSVRH